MSRSSLSLKNCFRLSKQTRPPLWTMDATFWGDPKGDATVLIHCNDGTGIISVASNRGTYVNIPIDASSDEKSVTMSGSGIYGRVSYSGVAMGKKEGDQYGGT